MSLTLAAELNYDYLKEAGFSNDKTGLSIFENPAVINWEPLKLSVLQANKLDSQWQSNNLYLTLPFSSVKVGLSFKNDTIGNISQTYQDTDGTFKTASSFSHQKAGVILTLGQNSLVNDICWGISNKFYYQKLGDKSVTAFGLDAGVIYKYSDNVVTGLALNDIAGTIFNWNDQISDCIPQSYVYFLSLLFNPVQFSYIHNNNSPYIKGSINLFEGLQASCKLPLQNMDQAQVALTLEYQHMQIQYEMNFNEIYAQNSLLKVSYVFGDQF
ncbi:MAG: hypothetical protein PHV30_11230 [Candidatus Margulisbacteria bacterium]|nr:hypothetical protein [Candidatus Margulisiibacteriota bacterium]